jgi:hypothetical protein
MSGLLLPRDDHGRVSWRTKRLINRWYLLAVRAMQGEVSCRGPVAMRRHSCARLLDPKKLPGALVPGLRSEFAQVIREPVPNYLAELMRRLDGEANDWEGDE